MLRNFDNRLNADVIRCLRAMGHGDDLVICDVNHPAASIAKDTTYGKMVDMSGCDIPTAAQAVLSLMPLDNVVERPVARMQIVGDPDGTTPIFGRIQAVIDAAEGRPIPMDPLERFAFYAAARRAFAIIRTADSGPYGCFILKKGVVDLPPL